MRSSSVALSPLHTSSSISASWIPFGSPLTPTRPLRNPHSLSTEKRSRNTRRKRRPSTPHSPSLVPARTLARTFSVVLATVEYKPLRPRSGFAAHMAASATETSLRATGPSSPTNRLMVQNSARRVTNHNATGLQAPILAPSARFRPETYQTQVDIDKFFGQTKLQRRELNLHTKDENGKWWFDSIERDENRHLLSPLSPLSSSRRGSGYSSVPTSPMIGSAGGGLPGHSNKLNTPRHNSFYGGGTYTPSLGYTSRRRSSTQLLTSLRPLENVSPQTNSGFFYQWDLLAPEQAPAHLNLSGQVAEAGPLKRARPTKIGTQPPLHRSVSVGELRFPVVGELITTQEGDGEGAQFGPRGPFASPHEQLESRDNERMIRMPAYLPLPHRKVTGAQLDEAFEPRPFADAACSINTQNTTSHPPTRSTSSTAFKQALRRRSVGFADNALPGAQTATRSSANQSQTIDMADVDPARAPSGGKSQRRRPAQLDLSPTSSFRTLLSSGQRAGNIVLRAVSPLSPRTNAEHGQHARYRGAEGACGPTREPSSASQGDSPEFLRTPFSSSASSSDTFLNASIIRASAVQLPSQQARFVLKARRRSSQCGPSAQHPPSSPSPSSTASNTSSPTRLLCDTLQAGLALRRAQSGRRRSRADVRPWSAHGAVSAELSPSSSLSALQMDRKGGSASPVRSLAHTNSTIIDGRLRRAADNEAAALRFAAFKGTDGSDDSNEDPRWQAEPADKAKADADAAVEPAVIQGPRLLRSHSISSSFQDLSPPPFSNMSVVSGARNRGRGGALFKSGQRRTDDTIGDTICEGGTQGLGPMVEHAQAHAFDRKVTQGRERDHESVRQPDNLEADRVAAQRMDTRKADALLGVNPLNKNLLAPGGLPTGEAVYDGVIIDCPSVRLGSDDEGEEEDDDDSGGGAGSRAHSGAAGASKNSRPKRWMRSAASVAAAAGLRRKRSRHALDVNHARTPSDGATRSVA